MRRSRFGFAWKFQLALSPNMPPAKKTSGAHGGVPAEPTAMSVTTPAPVTTAPRNPAVTPPASLAFTCVRSCVSNEAGLLNAALVV
jgi:hypothetical protein